MLALNNEKAFILISSSSRAAKFVHIFNILRRNERYRETEKIKIGERV